MLKLSELLTSSVQERLLNRVQGLEHRMLMLFGLYFCAALVLCLAMADTEAMRWTGGLALLASIGLLRLGQNQLSYHWRVILLTLVMGTFVFLAALQTGGIHASIVSWIVVLPCLLIMHGQKAALKLVMASLLMIGVLLTMSLYNPSQLGPLGQQAASEQALWSLGIQVVALVAMFFCIVLFELLQQRRHQEMVLRTEQLEGAHTALASAKAYQDNVVASVSHELRTPMNAILGFNDLIQTDIRDPQALKISEHISVSARQLLRVINSILDYSQLLAGKFQFQIQPVDVRAMATHLAQTYAPQAENKSLQWLLDVSVDVPDRIHADLDRLTLVLEHLLGNALKFTHQGHVSLRFMAHDGHIRIEVADTGIGIPLDQQTKVFGRFHQGSQEINRRYGGTGLGLAICEQIVRLHGGRMGLVSQEGVGSTFWLELDNPTGLPADSLAATSPAPQVQSAASIPSAWHLRLAAWMLRHWQKLITPYVQAAGDDRAVVFLVFTLGLIFISPIYALPYPDAVPGTLGWMLSPVIIVVLYLLQKGLVSVQASSVVICIYCTAHLYGMALYTGGIHSSTMLWFAVAPMSLIYLLGIRLALVCLGISLLANVSMAWITYAGLLPVDHSVVKPSWVWPVVNYIHLCLLFPSLPMYYKYLNAKTRQGIREKNDSLMAAQEALLLEKARMDEFIASVSHEFRTPMNAIMGFTDLLQEHLHGSASALEMHGHMTQSAKHLLTVIDDILDYSQLKKGQLTIRREAFELRRVCESAYLMFKPRVQARHIDYRFRMDEQALWVDGDSHRLMQLLVNLLGNALKFTDEGLVELSVKPHDGGVLFVVRDSGIGIAEEQQGSLFQNFEQVHADMPGRYEGNGLGLAISKRLVELQGGRITVSSALGVGSAFSMWLPLVAVAAPMQEEKPQKPSPERQDSLKILVVDDHPLNRLLVRQMLERNWPQAELMEAEDGAQAVDQIKRQTFDVVLMDMVMPVMDGIEATRYIRQHMQAPHNQTPILGLTANVNPADKQRCLDAGMKDVLYKPLNREVLIHHIGAIIQQV